MKSRRRLSWLFCGWERININNDRAVEKTKAATQDWRSILPGILISLAALAVVFYFIDFRKLVESLQHANYGLVAISIVLTTVWLVIRTMFWRTLLRNRASVKQVFYTVSEGYLLNNFLPFRLGEVGRSYLLSRKTRLSFWEVFSTILIERLLDVVMAAVLFLTAITLVISSTANADAASKTRVVFLMGGVMLAGLLVLFLLARFNKQALGLFEAFGRRWPLLLRLGGKAVPTFLSGLGVLTDGWLFLRAISWLLVNWLLSVLQYYVMMKAFFPNANLLAVVFCLGAAAFGIAAPSSPGGLGVFEAAVLWALSLLGFDQSTAFAFALVTHLTTYLVNGAIGAFSLSREGFTLGSLYNSLRRFQPQKEG